jgi:hypothetical protein
MESEQWKWEHVNVLTIILSSLPFEVRTAVQRITPNIPYGWNPNNRAMSAIPP